MDDHDDDWNHTYLDDPGPIGAFLSGVVVLSDLIFLYLKLFCKVLI